MRIAFDYQTYLAGGYDVVTRDGIPVTVIGFNPAAFFPLSVQLSDCGGKVQPGVGTYTEDGCFLADGNISNKDLFLVTKRTLTQGGADAMQNASNTQTSEKPGTQLALVPNVDDETPIPFNFALFQTGKYKLQTRGGKFAIFKKYVEDGVNQYPLHVEVAGATPSASTATADGQYLINSSHHSGTHEKDIFMVLKHVAIKSLLPTLTRDPFVPFNYQEWQTGKYKLRTRSGAKANFVGYVTTGAYPLRVEVEQPGGKMMVSSYLPSGCFTAAAFGPNDVVMVEEEQPTETDFDLTAYLAAKDEYEVTTLDGRQAVFLHMDDKAEEVFGKHSDEAKAPLCMAVAFEKDPGAGFDIVYYPRTGIYYRNTLTMKKKGAEPNPPIIMLPAA